MAAIPTKKQAIAEIRGGHGALQHVDLSMARTYLEALESSESMSSKDFMNLNGLISMIVSEDRDRTKQFVTESIS